MSKLSQTLLTILLCFMGAAFGWIMVEAVVGSANKLGSQKNWYGDHGYIEVNDRKYGRMWVRTDDIPMLKEAVKAEK